MFSIFIWFSLDLIFFFLYIFLNSTVLLCSIFHLLPLFLIHLNFHINFFLLHFHLPPLFLPSYLQQKGQYSLSFSNFVFVFVFGGFFFFNCFKHFFFSTNGYFCYCWFNCHITFVFLFGKFVLTFMHIYVVWHSNFRSQVLFLYPIGLIWFGLIINCFAS